MDVVDMGTIPCDEAEHLRRQLREAIKGDNLEEGQALEEPLEAAVGDRRQRGRGALDAQVLEFMARGANRGENVIVDAIRVVRVDLEMRQLVAAVRGDGPKERLRRAIALMLLLLLLPPPASVL
eukprot:GEZU01012273.1.p2 GENE.GEZU01012273.1~~GEZU01012273.1.p2  ORF type:complete len:124 (-),score=17.30 GEZU01012273.1:35-406(-)